MASRNIVNPQRLLWQSRFQNLQKSKLTHHRTPTGHKTEDLNPNKMQNCHKMAATKKPHWQQSASTKHTAKKDPSKQVLQISTSFCNLREEEEYVEHLRRILSHLQQTSSILQSNRKQNLSVYRSNLAKMEATKMKLVVNQIILEEEVQEIRQSIKQRVQKL